ncbi:MAG: hypothetical protein ACJ77K_00460 [Bacteroidia bacterium]
MKTEILKLVLSAGIVVAVTAGCNDRSTSTSRGGSDPNGNGVNHRADGSSTGADNPVSTTASTKSSRTYSTASGTDSDASLRMDSGYNTGKKDDTEKLNNMKKGTRGSTGSGGSAGTTGSTTKKK